MISLVMEIVEFLLRICATFIVCRYHLSHSDAVLCSNISVAEVMSSCGLLK